MVESTAFVEMDVEVRMLNTKSEVIQGSVIALIISCITSGRFLYLAPRK